MYRFKRLLLTAMWGCVVQTSTAQQHYNAWFRGTLTVPLKEQIKTDIEFQHRRQNGYQNSDMLYNNLMLSFRNWIYYQHSPDLKLSLAPFAYFRHYRVIQNQTDDTVRPSIEVRFSAAAELQHRLWKRFYIAGRTAVEYRIFDNQQSNITRLRNRLGFSYNLAVKLKLAIFDELFFNLSGTSKCHFFDHNRIGVNVEYKVLSKLKFDIGYIQTSRLPLTSATELYENNFFLNFSYHLKNHKKRNMR